MSAEEFGELDQMVDGFGYLRRMEDVTRRYSGRVFTETYGTAGLLYQMSYMISHNRDLELKGQLIEIYFEYLLEQEDYSTIVDTFLSRPELFQICLVNYGLELIEDIYGRQIRNGSFIDARHTAFAVLQALDKGLITIEIDRELWEDRKNEATKAGVDSCLEVADTSLVFNRSLGFDLRYFHELYGHETCDVPRYRADEIRIAHEANLRRERIEAILERARKRVARRG